MERLSLPFFYQMGAQVNPLTKFTPDINNRILIHFASFPAHSYVYTILTSYASLTVCRAAGTELINAILEVQKWINVTPPNKWKDIDAKVDVLFSNVVNKAKEFETILSAELQTLATYRVTEKGIYSTSGLIDNAENMLPESIKIKISKDVVEELRQSGRCLAFDVPTASGFHILRATEAVLHEYYLIVCKPKTEAKLDSWAAYLAELRKYPDLDVTKVVAILQQIKDQDRNLIMHPEIVLSPDDAFALFEIAKGAIMAMADKLPAVKKK